MQASFHLARVDALQDEAQDIRSFRISRVDGLPFDAYEPGAHIDVTSPSGVTRQYSLCGDPAQRASYQFAVKKELRSRGGSRSLHDDVRVGTELAVGTPRNLFRIADDARAHLLIAAGIGVTPLLSMAYRLVERRAPFRLHYFVRSRAHAAFFERLSSEPFAPHVALHVGIEPPDLAAALDACVTDAAPGTHLYTCGPAPFMDQVVARAAVRIDETAIHLERFAAEPPLPVAEGDAFEMRLQRSGRSIRVDDRTSIVDALASIGVEVDTSCGEGVCGTCMVPVVSGEPDHRDHCLSRAERASNKVICCCVSRSRSPVLVLDL
ncbi:PDR/VanB family oxidoreductase [Burkholderia oklahomensis]|uniref:PDR/VanB family oxidoreductase n=1 Tax=Burkholderia oklahomensis TaxID=342113 RepID=UPI00016A983A|nr:PDR/VanB family oxidoreductase [Burkholderia oklahomensis]AJX34175.1 2Fe-2S iron-sulfur cluster binding domain protein [Burkholderia oklahomensis C6786]AOI48123.1 ferredoxin [Burkholderia oklahomensis C6786]KUY50008.1 ferredoxin [Burkholderia oklahomensis C6786]MBI0363747.1 oxidoreductase [Burkholderia oklahomensis]SUY27874.1 Phthalate dioxygenase reductase [Burkholderia oklahomensis]